MKAQSMKGVTERESNERPLSLKIGEAYETGVTVRYAEFLHITLYTAHDAQFHALPQVAFI